MLHVVEKKKKGVLVGTGAVTRLGVPSSGTDLWVFATVAKSKLFRPLPRGPQLPF